MGLFSFEHSRTTYLADFAVHGAAVLALLSALAVLNPEAPGLELPALVALGWLAWSLAEYLLHRFVLHGLKPFSTLHGLHHQQPQALLATPTVVSAGLILVLVLLPLLALAEAWRAVAVTLGVAGGLPALLAGPPRHPPWAQPRCLVAAAAALACAAPSGRAQAWLLWHQHPGLGSLVWHPAPAQRGTAVRRQLRQAGRGRATLSPRCPAAGSRWPGCSGWPSRQ